MLRKIKFSDDRAPVGFVLAYVSDRIVNKIKLGTQVLNMKNHIVHRPAVVKAKSKPGSATIELRRRLPGSIHP